MLPIFMQLLTFTLLLIVEVHFVVTCITEVKSVAKSFIKLGVQPHMSVAIIGFNSPRWFISYLGAIMVRYLLALSMIVIAFVYIKIDSHIFRQVVLVLACIQQTVQV